ncbi:MAG: ABC transporter substrate-binding protein [Pseudomonas sp.]|nr:ABC transporter substrate-binding protein [Pseudomonas sp.]
MRKKSLLLACALLITLQAHADTDVVLRVGQQKGLTRAMLESAGQLKDVPYTLEWAEFPASAYTLEAMGADKIDVATVGDGPMIFAVGAGAPIRPIASVRIVDQGEGNVILVKKDSGIDSVAQLKGKRLAFTRGSSGHQLVLAALQSVGLSSADVTGALLSPADGKAAFDSGDVDAWAVWQPYVAIALSRGDTKVLVNSAGLLSEYAFVAANQNAIRDKKAALDDFVQRLARATDWSEQHLEQYLDIESRLTGLNRDILRQVHESMRPHIQPLDNAAVAGLQTTVNLYQGAGILKRPLKLEDFFDPALIARYQARAEL